MLRAFGREVQEAELVVEPDVAAVHARVDEIVEVLAAGNPRIERDAAIRIRMQDHATAAADVGTAQARAAKDALDVVVEIGRLVPEMVIPGHVLGRLGAVVAVVEKTGLGRDDRPRRSLARDAVHGALEKVGIGDDLVIIDEDDRVMTEYRGDDETEVSNGAVARETSRALVLADAHLLEPAVDMAHLRLADNDNVEVHEVVGDGAHALDRLVLDARLRRDEQDDAIDADDVTQGLQAPGQLARLVDGSHVVVHDATVDRM